MGFRYGRRIRLAPGVRLNLSKSGVGYSVGRRGMWLTKRGDGGRQATVGLPGTGLSYTARQHEQSPRTGTPMTDRPNKQARGFVWTAPPGWPPAQPGWAPPAGWQPDPSWPPPPSNWQWWQPALTSLAGPALAGKPTSASRHSTAAVVVALLLFFPLGLLWMWRERTFNTALRWTVTAFATLVLVGAATSGPAKPVESTQQSASSTQGLTLVPTPSAPATGAVIPTTAPTAVPLVATPRPPPVAPTAAAPHTAPPTPAVTTQAAAPRQQATPSAAARPAATPAPAKLCGAPANPYGYNYCGRGSNIYSPQADICSYFTCIAAFSDGTGYMEECQDSTVSMSGGRRGACSHHGGELVAVTV